MCEQYYNNYLLDVYEWDLTDGDKRSLDEAIWIVDNKCSIRMCSKEYVRSKSSIHRDIHNKVRLLSYELYQCVKKQFAQNKRRYFQ